MRRSQVPDASDDEVRALLLRRWSLPTFRWAHGLPLQRDQHIARIDLPAVVHQCHSERSCRLWSDSCPDSSFFAISNGTGEVGPPPLDDFDSQVRSGAPADCLGHHRRLEIEKWLVRGQRNQPGVTNGLLSGRHELRAEREAVSRSGHRKGRRLMLLCLGLSVHGWSDLTICPGCHIGPLATMSQGTRCHH